MSGLTFSAERCLVPREKVDMDRAGREEDWAGMPLEVEGFSGESEVARLAEGVLLCGDAREVEALLVAPLESFVRRLALLLRWMVVVMSPKVDEMLWRDACLRRGGVEGTWGAGGCWGTCTWAGNSYWLARRVSASPMGDTGRRLMAGGGEAAVRASGGSELVGVLGGLCRPPKKEGLREKMLWVCDWDCGAPNCSSSAMLRDALKRPALL